LRLNEQLSGAQSSARVAQTVNSTQQGDGSMARRDLDFAGDPFANIDNPVTASGTWDDVMVVQGLLLLYWQTSKMAQRAVPSTPPVDGATHKTNSILIGEFQKEFMKRRTGAGFVNPALHFDAKSLAGSTIYQLNVRAVPALLKLKHPFKDAIEFLVGSFPKLAAPLGGRERHTVTAD